MPTKSPPALSPPRPRQRRRTSRGVPVVAGLLSLLCTKTTTVSLNVGGSLRNQHVSRRSLLNDTKSFAGILAFILFGGADSLGAKNLPDVAASDLSKVGRVEAILPVIELLEYLRCLQSEIQRDSKAVLQQSLLDRRLPQDEKSFKLLFDSFSNPVSYKQRFLDQNAFLVYYTRGFDGPGRPSIEEDVNVKQTLQYGYRNEAWVAYDEFLSEWRFAQEHRLEFDPSDLMRPVSLAISSIEAYLGLAPTDVVMEGRSRLDKRR